MSTALGLAADACGGISKLADMIGATPQQVSNWRTRGVPIEHCAAIERATGGKVSRRDLRPDDWARIWPELQEPGDLVTNPAQPAAEAQA